MKLAEPVDIDLLDFIKNGRFDYILLGKTKEWIINNFPDPDDIDHNCYQDPIWRYGNIEFHFHEDETLSSIYSDYIDTLSGGDSLRLEKWIFNESQKLTIETAVRHLIKERIAFKLEYGSLSDGYTTAAVRIIKSQVKLSFALPEREEDYEEYLARCKSEDSNSFRLFAFSLGI
ncbi:hypothetical protein [Hymenobacter lucidus]|uniref:Uncharacterized protein n=1 Tax=Hymenobacter lucidus TaxID=2880930 RepID=A0ABS8AWK0_9BACT|nr:hypothetical protein [Hymenobacter lucidus]MCB2410173.1 hypothetical protein [Hymenobacter lucidus]